MAEPRHITGILTPPPHHTHPVRHIKQEQYAPGDKVPGEVRSAGGGTPTQHGQQPFAYLYECILYNYVSGYNIITFPKIFFSFSFFVSLFLSLSLYLYFVLSCSLSFFLSFFFCFLSLFSGVYGAFALVYLYDGLVVMMNHSLRGVQQL